MAVEPEASSDGGTQDSLVEAFWAVARRLRQHSRATLAPWDVAPSHVRALVTVLRHGPMRLSGLSDHLHIAPRSATEVVDALAERGLVERRPDPADRRAVLVVPTEAGVELGRAIRAARAAETESLLGVLDDADREALARILARLLAQPPRE